MIQENINDKQFDYSICKKCWRQIEKEPQDAFGGGYHAYFTDLDGYYWEVSWGPNFTFDENDMWVF